MTVDPIVEAFPFVEIMVYMSVSFIIAFFGAPVFIQILHKYKLGKNIRTEASGGGMASLFRALHLKKAGTPTMGGVLMWGTVVIIVIMSRLLSYFGIIDASLLSRQQVYLPLFTLVVMGVLGAVDDYLNIIESKYKGLPVRPKMFFILLFSLAGAWWFFAKLGYSSLFIPGYGVLEIGYWYIPLFVFMVSATSNAVNITDGLDGLAGGLLNMSFASFAVLAYLKGLYTLSLFCAVIMGVLMAFLWFNVPPARFYMGDTGSLALGATLAVIAMMTDFVFVLPVIGLVFVVETLSVIIQIASKKLRGGKKVFHIAPIHHHFEHIGWTESQIVMRAWILGAFFSGLGVILGSMSL